MEDYLPPIVTRLKGDWSDLRAAFLESLAAAKAWSQSMRAEIVDGLRNAGHQGGLAFADALKTTAAKELLEGFDDDIGRKLADQGRKAGKRGGQSAAEGLIETVKGMFMPALIAAIVMFAPAIGAAIASAITLGLGLGLVGIAVLAQKSNPELVAVATGFKDIVVAAFKDATTPMLQPLKEALVILAQGLKDVAPGFKEIFGMLGGSGAIQALSTGLIGFIRALLPGLKELTPVMAQLITVLGTSFLPDLGKGLSGMFSELAKHGPEMVQFFTDFGAVLGDILPMIGQLLGGLTAIYAYVEHGKGQGFGLFGGIEMLKGAWPHVVAGAKAAWEWIKKVADAVGTWISGKAGAVADWWNGMVESVRTKGKEVLDWFHDLPGRVGEWLSALPGKLRDAASQAFDLFFFTVGFATARTLQFLGSLPERLADFATRTWEMIKARFVQGVDDTHTTVKGWADRLPGILEELWHQFTGWGQRVWETVTSWAAKTVTDTVSWWLSLPGKIGSAIGTVGKTIKDWASGAINWLFQAGKDMIQGMINGIASMVGRLVSAAFDAVKRALEGARAAQKSNSPSRAFAELGRFAVLGYIQGLQGEQAQLARAWTGLTPNSPVIGAASSPALAVAAAAASRGDDQAMFHGTINLDGQHFIEVLIPIAQQRKMRTGTTGLD